MHGAEARHVRVRERDAVRGRHDGRPPPRDAVPIVEARQPDAVAARHARLRNNLCRPDLLDCLRRQFPRLHEQHMSRMHGYDLLTISKTTESHEQMHVWITCHAQHANYALRRPS